jgi:Zn-dependent protease
MTWLTEPILMLRDLVVALVDVVTGRRRRRYEHSTLVHAAHDAVWHFLLCPRMRFDRVELEMVDEPILGMADAYRTRMTVRGQELPPAAYQKIDETEGSQTFRYLPAIEPAWGVGDDHLAGRAVAPAADGTRLTMFEELTHQAFFTRLYTPFALRSAARLIKEQCEADVGTPQAGAGWFAGHAALWIAAILSFWYLFGLAEALLLTVIVVLHELGHALAMRMVGLPVGFVTLVPFIGGMAAPKKPYESGFQHAFVALMGPGFSLVPTLALAGWYASSGEAWAGQAAFMFAFLNGVNLLPLYPLDGGVVANHLLGALDSRLGRAGAWAGVAVGVAAAAVLQSILIGVVFVLAAIMLFRAQGPALPLRPLHPVDFTAILIGYVIALALYIACVSFTVEAAA